MPKREHKTTKSQAPDKPTTVYRVVEVDAHGKFYTLLYPWQGSRWLPARRWLSAAPFQARLSGRLRGFRGFTAFRTLSAAMAFAQRCAGRSVALLECQAGGVSDIAGKDYVLCQDIYLDSQIAFLPLSVESGTSV
jgi:hypothetical protein